MNFVKFSRTPFLQNTSRRILLFLIYLTVSFCKEVLYICSNLLRIRKSDKNSQFWHLFPFANTFSTLYCEYILTIDQNINTRNQCKKRKKLRKKMKKWQIDNSEKSEISEISEKLFRVFDFALQPKSKTRI